MASTPRSADRQASLIRELNRSLSASRQEAGNLLPQNDTTTNGISLEIDLSNQDFTFPSDIGLDEDELGFRNLDKPTITPEMRTTAKKYGFYHPPPPPEHIPSSAVRREFQDFDHNNSPQQPESHLDQSSMSVEAGRGMRRSRSYATPKSDYYDVPSPSHFYSLNDENQNTDSPLAKKLAGLGDENMRKVAPSRSASNALHKGPEQKKAGAFKKGRVASYAETSAKIMADFPESSFVSEKASPQPKPSRFAPTTKNKNVLACTDPNIPSRYVAGKGLQPAQNAKNFAVSRATSNSAARLGGGGNSTKLSFALPDLENFSDMIGGVSAENHKGNIRSARLKSRFSTPGNNGQWSSSLPVHIPISSIPVPEEEKKIMASLRILKESVANLKRENTELRRVCESQELELLELRDGRGDTNLKSWHSDGAAKASKPTREAELRAAQASLDHAEREIALSEDTIRQITSQRDRAYAESERMDEQLRTLKEEKKSVEKENSRLRKSILRLEDQTHYLRDLLTETQKDVKYGKSGTGSAHLGEDISPIQQALQDENMRLRHEIEALNSELGEIRNARDNETKTWLKREIELQNQVIESERTLRHLQDGLTGVVHVAQQADPTSSAPHPSAGAGSLGNDRESDELKSVLDRFMSLHVARKQFRDQKRQAKLRSLERLDQHYAEETKEWKLQKDALVEEMNRRNTFCAQFEARMVDMVDRVPDEVTEVPVFDVHEAAQRLRQTLGAGVEFPVPRRNSHIFHEKKTRDADPVEATTHLDLPAHSSNQLRGSGKDEHKEHGLVEMDPVDTQVIRELRLRVEREFLTRELNGDNDFNPDDEATRHTGFVRDDANKHTPVQPDHGHFQLFSEKPIGTRISSGPQSNLGGKFTAMTSPTAVAGGETGGRGDGVDLSSPNSNARIHSYSEAGAEANQDRNTSSSEEDSTLRPSQPSLQALDAVMSDIEADIKQLRTTFAGLSTQLATYDPKENRRARKRVIENMMQVLSHLDVNSERVYHLQDARYGLVATGGDGGRHCSISTGAVRA